MVTRNATQGYPISDVLFNSRPETMMPTWRSQISARVRFKPSETSSPGVPCRAEKFGHRSF
eukprot:6329279-Prymnesium_polylepis.1